MSKWDVIIVGAGTAGLSAAIFGARQGLKVLALDVAPKMGGTLFLSTGQMSAAGTRLQSELGIDDNPDLHFDDIMRISRGTADPAIARLATTHAPATFDWLMEHGFDLRDGNPVEGVAHEAYTRRRYYWGKRDGLSILDVLLPEIESLIAAGEVTVELETEVV
jgi:fumarate reductase flavoprotein subunit